MPIFKNKERARFFFNISLGQSDCDPVPLQMTIIGIGRGGISLFAE